jgi:HJR/Mrr/RecB family endonuclease
MSLKTDQYNDHALTRAIEVIESLKKIGASTTLFEKPTLIDNILKRSGMLTLALLRNQPKGIKGLVARAGTIQKLDMLYSDRYLKVWDKLFTEADFFKGPEPLEVSEYDFFPEEVPSAIKVFAEVSKLERMISAIYLDNGKLYEIQPVDFEELVAEMLRKQGWEVKLTKKTRDGGYDMFALQQIGEIEFKMIAEVKRWAKNRKIGVDIIRAFQSVILNKGVNKGVLFTSSSFTKDARDYRGLHAPHLMDLKDYNDIIGWIGSHS